MPASLNRTRHWSKKVRDVFISHNNLQVRMDGGAEHAEFLYIGGFTSEDMKYRKGLFHLGDILIEFNDEPIVGLTQQDLMNRINKAGKKINFKVVEPGGGISKDMRDYLGQEFPSGNEVDLDLQDIIRDNLYSRTVPCTTRPPRSKEEPGIDYVFVSKENFEKMKRNGDFIESGSYNGHYYGTLKPKLKVDVAQKLSKINIKQSSLETRSCRDKQETKPNVEITNENENDTELNKEKTDGKIELSNHFTEV